jgi:hypothetical protein
MPSFNLNYINVKSLVFDFHKMNDRTQNPKVSKFQQELINRSNHLTIGNIFVLILISFHNLFFI